MKRKKKQKIFCVNIFSLGKNWILPHVFLHSIILVACLYFNSIFIYRTENAFATISWALNVSLLACSLSLSSSGITKKMSFCVRDVNIIIYYFSHLYFAVIFPLSFSFLVTPSLMSAIRENDFMNYRWVQLRHRLYGHHKWVIFIMNDGKIFFETVQNAKCAHWTNNIVRCVRVNESIVFCVRSKMIFDDFSLLLL